MRRKQLLIFIMLVVSFISCGNKNSKDSNQSYSSGSLYQTMSSKVNVAQNYQVIMDNEGMVKIVFQVYEADGKSEILYVGAQDKIIYYNFSVDNNYSVFLDTKEMEITKLQKDSEDITMTCNINDNNCTDEELEYFNIINDRFNEFKIDLKDYGYE